MEGYSITASKRDKLDFQPAVGALGELFLRFRDAQDTLMINGPERIFRI